MEWQPIETAPRGEVILVYVPAIDGVITVAFLDHNDDDWRTQVSTLGDFGWVRREWVPTHWMPLPPSPPQP